jgi:hypothetical protein
MDTMIVAISFVLAYASLGLAEVTDGLSANPIQKPAWAQRPTFGKMLLIFVTWPVASIANASWSENPRRAVAFTAMGIAVQFVALGALMWCAIRLAMFLSNNIYIEVALSIGFIVAMRFIMPVVNLLIMPVMMLLGAVLDLIFPLKS